MNEQYKEEKAKLAAIEKAVLGGTPDEVALYRKLTNSLLTARILGIGGRFRGLDMVKALVENGASFCKEGNFHFQTID